MSITSCRLLAGMKVSCNRISCPFCGKLAVMSQIWKNLGAQASMAPLVNFEWSMIPLGWWYNLIGHFKLDWFNCSVQLKKLHMHTIPAFWKCWTLDLCFGLGNPGRDLHFCVESALESSPVQNTGPESIISKMPIIPVGKKT